MKARLASALGAAAAVLALCPDASASGFNTARFGTEWGHPTTDNPTAIYYNPAAVTQADGFHLYIDGIFAFRHFKYVREEDPSNQFDQAARDAGCPGCNAGTAESNNWLAAPMIGATWKVFDWATIMGGLYVPFGGAAAGEKRRDLAPEVEARFPGARDGAARWHNIEGGLRFIHWGGGVAFNFDRWSVGVTGALIQAETETTRARTSTGVPSVPNEGRTFFDVQGLTYNLGAGIFVEALPEKLFIGASYQSQPGFGEFSVDGKIENNFQGSITRTQVNFVQELPDVIRAGFKYRLRKDIEVRAFGDFVRWSVFKNQCLAQRRRPLTPDESTALANGERVRGPSGGCKIGEDGSPIPRERVASNGVILEDRPVQNVKRDWNNAFGVRLGVSWWVTEPLELVVGVGYDGDPVPDATTDTGLWDTTDLSAAAGLKYNVTDDYKIGASFTYLHWLEHSVTPEDSRVDEFNPPSIGADGAGTYSSWVGIMNINMEWTF